MAGISFETPIDLEEGDSVEVEVTPDGSERIWVIRADGRREAVAAPKREHPLFTSDVKASFTIRRD